MRRSGAAARPAAPQLAAPRAAVAARAGKQGELTGVVFEPFTAVKVRRSLGLGSQA